MDEILKSLKQNAKTKLRVAARRQTAAFQLSGFLPKAATPFCGGLKWLIFASCIATAAISLMAQTPAPKEIVIDGVAGFQDTPMQPDGKWHVHDPARPQPPIVTPGTFSENAAPPSDAIILFDGKDLSQWRDNHGDPAPWKIEDGAMISQKSDIETIQKFGDIQLHLEFREPMPAAGDGQSRGNSGVFLIGQY